MYQCISLNAYTPYAVGMECCKLHSSIINNILDTRKRVHHLSILLMTICACAVHEWSYKLCNASQQSNDCLFWFLRCPYSREIKLLVHIFTYRKRRKWCRHAALKHPQIYHLIKLFLFLCFFFASNLGSTIPVAATVSQVENEMLIPHLDFPITTNEFSTKHQFFIPVNQLIGH